MPGTGWDKLNGTGWDKPKRAGLSFRDNFAMTGL